MKKREVERKKKEKNNILYSNFKLSWIYLKKSYLFIIIAIVLILLASIIGYLGIINLLFPTLGKSIDNFVTNSVQELIQQTESLGSIELTLFIMINNIKTAFFGLVFGFFLTIPSVIIIVFNGYVLGFVAQRAVVSPENTEGILILWRLLPHGIFEIPAILISIGIGIKLGLYPIFLKEKGKGFVSLLISFVAFIFFTMIIMALLTLFTGSLSSSPESIVNTQNKVDSLINNPIFSIIFYMLIGLSYLASLFIGIKILSKSDKIKVKEIFINSLRVFIFIIIPLLILAGLIEGILIALV